jgi:hypothetical protein
MAAATTGAALVHLSGLSSLTKRTMKSSTRMSGVINISPIAALTKFEIASNGTLFSSPLKHISATVSDPSNAMQCNPMQCKVKHDIADILIPITTIDRTLECIPECSILICKKDGGFLQHKGACEIKCTSLPDRQQSHNHFDNPPTEQFLKLTVANKSADQTLY